MYCIYLTVYHGNKLPPFYIGYSTIDKIRNGYKGTVQSSLYKSIFNQELKDNPHLFKTFIISTCDTRQQALSKESQIQRYFKVHRNPMYINMAVSNEKFYCTDHSFKQTESYSRKVSQNNKDRWSDPRKREELIVALRASKSTDAYRKKQSIISKQLAQDPNHINKIKKGVKESWKKDGERERRSKIMMVAQNKPECIEKRKLKKWWTDGTTSIHSETCPPGFYRGRVTPWQ